MFRVLAEEIAAHSLLCELILTPHAHFAKCQRLDSSIPPAQTTPAHHTPSTVLSSSRACFGDSHAGGVDGDLSCGPLSAPFSDVFPRSTSQLNIYCGSSLLPSAVEAYHLPLQRNMPLDTSPCECKSLVGVGTLHPLLPLLPLLHSCPLPRVHGVDRAHSVPARMRHLILRHNLVLIAVLWQRRLPVTSFGTASAMHNCAGSQVIIMERRLVATHK